MTSGRPARGTTVRAGWIRHWRSANGVASSANVPSNSSVLARLVPPSRVPARNPLAALARALGPARPAPRSLALPAAPVRAPNMLTQAIASMLGTLGTYVPPAPDSPPLPLPSVTVSRVEERTGSLGDVRGSAERLSFPVDLRVTRLTGGVRFQVWADGPDVVDLKAGGIIHGILGDAEKLRRLGFLELALEDSRLAEFFAPLPAWRKAVDFRVLFEFHYEASDDTGGLIATVPVEIREQLGGAAITGGIGLWDETAAPALVLRGRRSLTRLAALTHLPGAAPGAMTITRTFDGAAGNPTDFATLATFLDAVAGPSPASLHARVEFASVVDFLDALSGPGAPLQFVDENGAPRAFEPRALDLDEPIVLPDRTHRLEFALSAAPLGASQIVYLHAGGDRTHTN